jgi:hypothetical protein
MSDVDNVPAPQIKESRHCHHSGRRAGGLIATRTEFCAQVANLRLEPLRLEALPPEQKESESVDDEQAAHQCPSEDRRSFRRLHRVRLHKVKSAFKAFGAAFLGHGNGTAFLDCSSQHERRQQRC